MSFVLIYWTELLSSPVSQVAYVLVPSLSILEVVTWNVDGCKSDLCPVS